MSSAYLRLLIFLQAVLIPACDSSSPACPMIYPAYKLNNKGWQYAALTYSFPNLELVHCSMSSSNYCFLTCIQIFQEADKVVCCSHLLKNFLQFVVILTVKGFGTVNKLEVDVFWNSLAFSMIQRMLAIWSVVPLPLLNPTWTSGSSWFMYY